MNIHSDEFFWCVNRSFHYLQQISKSTSAELYNKCIFSSMRNCPTFFQSGYIIKRVWLQDYPVFSSLARETETFLVAVIVVLFVLLCFSLLIGISELWAVSAPKPEHMYFPSGTLHRASLASPPFTLHLLETSESCFMCFVLMKI